MASVRFAGDDDLDLYIPCDPDDRLVVADAAKVGRALAEVLTQPVVRFGACSRLNDYVNFTHADTKAIVAAKGFFLASSWCQSDKSVFINALAILQQRLTSTPMILASADVKGNIDELANKLAFMAHLGVAVVPIRTDADVRRLQARRDCIMHGRIMPLVQTNAAQVRRIYT